MIKILKYAKSWFARKKHQKKPYLWFPGTAVASLSAGLMSDDKKHIESALNRLTSEINLNLADDQETLLNLISICSEYSSPENLEFLISFWTGEYGGFDQRNATPVHAVLGNNRYSRIELWKVLLKIFPVDLPRSFGATALSDAASSGSLEDIDCLLQLGASPVSNIKCYEGYDPLAFALFFNEERIAFEKLLNHATNSEFTATELINLLLFNVCAYGFHGGEYPAKKRLLDMKYLISLGARYDYQFDNANDIAIFSLEKIEFEPVLEDVLKIVISTGFDLLNDSNHLVKFIDQGWNDRPKLIRLLYKHGVNFNSGYRTWSDKIEPVWFNILHFSYSQPDDWLSVIKELLDCGVNLDLRDSSGRNFCDVKILPGKTKLDKYNTLNQLKTFGLSEDMYANAVRELED